MYGNQDSDTGKEFMKQMKKENIDDGLSLQLFTIELDKMVTGNCTFVFRICIEGSVPGYSYQLSDRLAKDQLWAAAKSWNLVDVEVVVKDKTFPAHKAILAARSKVFAAEFTKKQPAAGAVGPHQIRIDGVEPSTVEQFLHFIYTGESMGTFANEELLKLADGYELTTLSNLCRTALKKIKPMQMVNLLKHLNKNAEVPSSSNIRIFPHRPDKETEIFFDRTTPTFRCTFSFIGTEREKSKCVMTYQSEEIFFALYITGDKSLENYIVKPVFHCSCAQHRSFGLIPEDIYFSSTVQFKEPKGFYTSNTAVYFDIKVISTVGNYYYEMMDDAWMKDFWFAATNQKFTDVEIFVGTVKLMEAHWIILSAQSPVLNALMIKISNTRKSIVTFGAEFDVDTVKHFLKFLYTGLLEISAKTSVDYKQLLKLATIYEVETLKNMCELANSVPNVEELTNSLFEL